MLRTEDGARLPLTLTMLLFDSSGVNRAAARREHSEALARVTAAAGEAEADRFDVACGLDWLLYDWLMAHRVDADSAEIVIPKGREDDAAARPEVTGTLGVKVMLFLPPSIPGAK